MSLWARWFQALCSGVLCLLVLAEVSLNLGEEAGGIPFFNDGGSLTLPSESQVELEESMPEARLFRRPAPLVPADRDTPPHSPERGAGVAENP